MITLAIAIFIFGYIIIAMEHKIQIDKSSIALILGVTLWAIYASISGSIVPTIHAHELKMFLEENPTYAALSPQSQYFHFISEKQLMYEVGEIASTLLFLIGAMTVVEVIDVHGGFSVITNLISTRKKSKLLWLISFITFFMSAALDNMTSAIVMVMLVRKLIVNYKERWVFGSMIILAANSGGAWSPIGDITTIMLWMKGNISSLNIMQKLFLPCIVSVVVPLIFASKVLHGIVTKNISENSGSHNIQQVITRSEMRYILFLGVGLLICIPIFKDMTHLPPFMGIIAALGIMWLYTDLLYRKKSVIKENEKMRVREVIRKIDMPTVLFFLGILLAVGALKEMGVLDSFSKILEDKVGNVYVIGYVIGILSAIVDNVPLVAAAIGMYPVVSPEVAANAANAQFMANFVHDGIFWEFLAYCAGVGGSLLIIGSVAGVVVMGIEKISFGWYFKNVTFWAFLGYTAGAITYYLQNILFY